MDVFGLQGRSDLGGCEYFGGARGGHVVGVFADHAEGSESELCTGEWPLVEVLGGRWSVADFRCSGSAEHESCAQESVSADPAVVGRFADGSESAVEDMMTMTAPRRFSHTWGGSSHIDLISCM